MILLDLIADLETLLEWLKQVRFTLCTLVALAMAVRIAILWMSGGDRRQAIEDTLWWLAALAFLSMAHEIIEEIFYLLGRR